MIKTSFLNSQKMPLVVEPRETIDFQSFLQITAAKRERFHKNLLLSGALLFRDFRVETIDAFEKFVRLFSGKDLFNYAGGVSPRRSLSGGVYTSTEYPAEVPLSLHNEMSYSENFPRHLYFFCLTAPEQGGATTLGDSRRILRKIDRKIVDLFKDKKVCYIRNLQGEKGSGYSWQEAFETDDRSEVENRCRKIGADFDWKDDGGLRVHQTRPATATHPITKEEVWFNQADGFHPSNLGEEFYQTKKEFRLNCCFGDGSPICPLSLNHIRGVLASETIPHRWQTSDILVLDNILTAHGRMPFTGARKITLAMTQ